MKQISWRRKMVIWIKRATGIGYKDFPSIDITVYPHKMDELEEAKTKAEAIKKMTYEFENAVYNAVRRRNRIH